MENRAIIERTEVGGRPKIDTRHKGIARIPAARSWLKRMLIEARERGETALAAKVAKRVKQLGLKP